jgi:hypothetical protein
MDTEATPEQLNPDGHDIASGNRHFGGNSGIARIIFN